MKLTMLLTLGFRNVHKKAADWLRKTPWNSLFLSLPVESKPFVDAFAQGKIVEKEFWSNYTLLTGLAEPFVNSLRLRFKPVLDCVRDMYGGDRETHCYQDLKSHVEEKKISEKILLLQFRYRATGKLDLQGWRSALLEEIKTLEESWHRSVNRILEEVEEARENIILYGGHLQSTKYLSGPDNEVEIILMEDHWKSPLDILRTILWKHGFDNVSDEKIEPYLKLQKKYLDLIINSKDVDEAHEAWTRIVQKQTMISIS